jgi:hypothetical protein
MRLLAVGGAGNRRHRERLRLGQRLAVILDLDNDFRDADVPLYPDAHDDPDACAYDDYGQTDSGSRPRSRSGP